MGVCVIGCMSTVCCSVIYFSYFIELKYHVCVLRSLPLSVMEQCLALNQKSIRAHPFLSFPFRPISCLSFPCLFVPLLSSLLLIWSFKDGTKGKCQLCSIWLHPQDICRHIQTRTGGAVIPVSAQTLLDHNPRKEKSEKMRSAPIHPLIPPLVFSSRT